MTSPGYAPRHGIIDAAARRLSTHAVPVPAAQFAGKPARTLSAAERAAAAEIASQPGGVCRLCGCLHAAEESGCPRLASFELDNDGKVRAGTFWPPGTWEDPERIIWADDARELPEEAPDGHQ